MADGVFSYNTDPGVSIYISPAQPFEPKISQSHLEPESVEPALSIPETSACWHCELKSIKCGTVHPCERCSDLSLGQKSHYGLGCVRTKLIELLPYFLPELIAQLHEGSRPKTSVEHVQPQHWGDFSLTDPITNMKIHDDYVSNIVDNHLEAFIDLCWTDNSKGFLRTLCKLTACVKLNYDDEAKLVREVFRLVVVTFIMPHTLSVAAKDKHPTLSQMYSCTTSSAYPDNLTLTHMIQPQTRYLFSRIQHSILSLVLYKLQNIFISSKGYDNWVVAMIAVLGMCIALEDQQRTIHSVMSMRSATEGMDVRDAQEQADTACRKIDTWMLFVTQIFRWKYNHERNPIKNANHNWEKEVKFGDEGSVEFVRQVAFLTKNNTDYLRQQGRVSISHTNQSRYSARLVGAFLLSFWLPNAS